MLINLFIKDFGIIEQTEINFTEGLNVLSGETGAGKSIVVDAIKILVGGRALDEYIRSGCDLCFVQGTFSLDNSLGVVQLLSDNGFYLEDEQLIILSREIKRNGRNFCRINGQMVTLALLKDVGSKLIDLQGQNEQQLLFNPDIQLFLLDAYGGKSLTDCRDRVSKLYSQWLEIKNNLEDFNKKNLDLAKRQDLISYQINEIDMAALRTGEEEELHTEKNRLSNKEKISQLLSECYQYIYQGVGIDSLYSALALTGRGMKSLDRLKEMDPAFTVPSELVAGALYQLEEACREISLEIERLDFYPMTLDTVEDRLALIQKLKKKYGSSIEEILAYGDRIKDELAELENNELRVELMEEELSIITSKLVGESDNLTEERKKTALILEKDITKELVDLEMPGIIFNVVFTKQKNITGIGNERIEFFITTNPGEPARPMSRVASGGETSRIMLAVKTILAELEGIPTLIFDEIETGIGGQTIWSLGQKLYQLSSKMQIISVTHSSPLASLAKNHLLIAKRNIKGRTSAEVETLDFEGRLRELTRMLGGSESEESQAALEHAKALLKKTNN